MTKRTVTEVVGFVEKLFDEEYSDVDVDAFEAEGGWNIKVKKMYEYVKLNFAKLEKLAEFFGTKDINDERYSSSGCETCDYGSSYVINLTVR